MSDTKITLFKHTSVGKSELKPVAEPSTKTTPSRGWGNPNQGNGRTKWHYFIGGFSLCQRWMFFNKDLEDSNDFSPDNCPKCLALLKPIREQEKNK